MSVSKTSIRAVQLDLARQKESMESIREFISFAAEWSYNTLFLYLEGVVHVPAFSLHKPEMSYETEDIRRIVEMAKMAGLEVVPGLATLGHANHFFEHESLRHLRESDSWSPDMFCPSHPETYAFLEAYVKETASLFPSRHVHIGCDEAWALGSCPACRERRRKGESREDIFICHVLRMHDFLGRLGKRVWIWSDMLETFSPEVLGRIPRDVVLCEWHYEAGQMSHDGFQGHFNNLRRRNVLALHAKSGHATVLCAAGDWSGGENDWTSTAALAEIGQNKNPFGFLLTNWGSTFLPGRLPAVAVAGRLWSHLEKGESAAFNVAFDKLFPNATAAERQALRYVSGGCLWQAKFSEIVHRGGMTREETRHLDAILMSIEILETWLVRLSAGRERDIVEETLTRTRLQACLGLLRQASVELRDTRTSPAAKMDSRRQFENALNVLDQLAQTRGEHWRRWRKGIPNTAAPFLRNLSDSLRQFEAKIFETPHGKLGALGLQLFLVECYSAPRLNVEIYDGSQWIPAVRGSYKPVNQRDASYSVEIPLFWECGDPQKLRITVSGYGGQGVQFASIRIGNRKWIPKNILSVRGSVENAGALLCDDAFPCFMGEKDTLKTLEQFSECEESILEIQLASAQSS